MVFELFTDTVPKTAENFRCCSDDFAPPADNQGRLEGIRLELGILQYAMQYGPHNTEK